MVNFHDPSVIVSDSWALVKLCHTVDSLYLWEFFISLDFEWNFIRGHRPYRWTIWIYSLTRMATFVAVVLNIVILDVTTPIDCQALITFELVFGYLAFVASSLLMVLRIIAIWKNDRTIRVIVIGLWVINIAFLIQGTARLRARWMPEQDICVLLNTESTKLNIIVTLVADIILLLIMFVGLVRLRRHGGGMFGLGQLLWKQGLIWLALATLADVPPAVLISLDLNDPLNLIFQVPSLTIMTIAATRMYRSLADFAPESTDMIQGTPQTNGRTVLGTKGTQHQCSSDVDTEMELTMYTAYEYPESSTNRPSGDSDTVV